MPAVTQRGSRRQVVIASWAAGAPFGVTDESAVARNTLELQTLQAFRMIFGSARRHDAEVRRLAGISGSMLWALSEIGGSPGLSVNTLAKRMALHQTTASNLVNALVEHKLIRRIRDRADQRVVRLHMAAVGGRMCKRAPEPHAGLLVDALRHLEVSQLTQLRKCLRVLIASMKRSAGTAAGETLLGE
ncbi:MAG TPA: MarR family winged helix-turn-helix transcriptional regulator [Steroidobacteraceae bacterium]